MVAPASAFADGKILLEDGIAFYESLDIDRAKARLAAAAVVEREAEAVRLVGRRVLAQKRDVAPVG